MTAYQAPLKDIRFTLRHICNLPELAALPGLDGSDLDVIDAALDEAGKLAGEVLAPLNRQGDTEGATLENGVVRTPEGFREAYAAYRDGGWNALPFDPAYGGMGLPWLIGIVCGELWNSANMGFALCPLLNQGAVEALHAHGNALARRPHLTPGRALRCAKRAKRSDHTARSKCSTWHSARGRGRSNLGKHRLGLDRKDHRGCGGLAAGGQEGGLHHCWVRSLRKDRVSSIRSPLSQKMKRP